MRLLTIDRQERRNALDKESLIALLEAVDGTIDRGRLGSSRVLVLAGAGGHFCAGADLSGVEDPEFVSILNRVLTSLREAPLPTIAAVDGSALGAGTQLAAACDLRSAAPDATFGIPAAKLGLMTDEWTVRRLVALAGGGPARAMLLAAQTYSGAEAFNFGFVQRSGGTNEALGWADEIARLAPLTIAGLKVGLNETEAIPPASGAYLEAFARAWSSDDLQEGLAAFRERRPAVFKGE